MSATHGMAATFPGEIEKLNYLLDDWCAHHAEVGRTACSADFEVALFFRVKKHESDCEEKPGA